MIKTTKILLFFIIFIAINSYAQIITKINISGLSIVSRGTVLSYIPFEIGDNYNIAINKNIKNSLINTGFFKKISVVAKKNTLNIILIENPSIKAIKLTLVSEKLIDKEKITETFDDFDIIKGRIYSAVKLKKILNQLKKTYHAAGYHNAIINHDINIDNKNRATIIINIKENDILKIKSMKIVGQTITTEQKLLDLFKIGEPDIAIVNFFTKKDNYSKIALDAGIAEIINFYFNKGYLDVKITKNDLKINKDKTLVDINIYLKEGNQYSIGTVDFNAVFNKEILKTLINTNTGDIFNRQQILADNKKLVDFFENQGYAFAQINLKTTKDLLLGNIVNLVFDIKQNNIIHINRIVIEGNTRTADEVIRRRLTILEGGVYSNTKLEESVNNIKRLGFFENVEINTAKVIGSNDKIDLHINVIERKTGNFFIGLSHSSKTGVAFNLGVQENNIFGTGNTLKLDLSYGDVIKNINFYFLDPYWTIDGHSINYGVFFKRTDASKLKLSSYTVDKRGVSFGYGIPTNKHANTNFNIRLSKIKIACDTTFSGITYEKEQCEKPYSSELLTSVSWIKNTLNNYYFASKGSLSNIKISTALPIADYSYAKLDINYEKYYELGNDYVFKFNTKAGIARGINGKELPFFERYYGGGATSLRGFKFNSLGDKYPNGKSMGGKISLLSSVAVISPIKWIEDSKNMRISAFLDIGGIYKDNGLKLADLRASIGIAFVWITPIAPLGLYLATPIIKKSADETKTLDFTLGVIF